MTLCGVRVTFDFKIAVEKHLHSVSDQLLKDLVSRGSPGECSMIDRFLGDAFGVLSCQFCSIVLQWYARLLINTLNYWTVQSVVSGF